MAGTLFVVATPIGHLDDITVRALRVLREVDLVAAEDTRRTGNLLRHFDIPTRLISVHAHNERSRAIDLIRDLKQGRSVALVSDAGTPGISDPGAEVVRLARHEGIRVEAVPGASAVAAAVSVAGLADTPFVFLGFPPTRSKDRKNWLERAARLHHEAALVFFEAPHRIRVTLGAIALLTDQSILVMRELTKLHEEVLEGPPNAIAERLSEPRGEFTVVVPVAQVVENKDVQVDLSAVAEVFGHMTTTEVGSSNREIAREVGKRFGLSTRKVYELLKKSPS